MDKRGWVAVAIGAVVLLFLVFNTSDVLLAPERGEQKKVPRSIDSLVGDYNSAESRDKENVLNNIIEEANEIARENYVPQRENFINEQIEMARKVKDCSEVETGTLALLKDEVVINFLPGKEKHEKELIISELFDQSLVNTKHYSDKNSFMASNGDSSEKRLEIFDRLVRVKFDSNDKNLVDVIKDVEESGSVFRVSPNWCLYALETFPDDEAFDELWGLHNTGQASSGFFAGTPDADIDSPEAWDLETGSGQIVVGVIDTGVEYTHPDLAANIWTNSDEIPNNGVDDDNNGYIDDFRGWDSFNQDNDPIDDHFHGTHVAGTIGAVGNNGLGVIGVNWNVKMMPLKFLGAGGSGVSSDAIELIQYGVNNGARILSNSWGGGGYDPNLQDAINEAHSNGVLFVAAAGNNNGDTENYFPAGYDNVLTVAATDNNDEKASFSNWGDEVEVSAPGVNILSTNLDGTYRYASGTSMACPHAAGLAALMLSRNPGLTPDELIFAMSNAVDDKGDLGFDVFFGNGRINAKKAMDIVDPDNSFPNILISSPVSGQDLFGSIDIVGTASGDNFESYVLEYAFSGSTSWEFLSSSDVAADNDLLGTIADTENFAEGPLVIRLTVNTIEGNQFFDSVVINIDNIITDFTLPNVVNPIHVNNQIEIFGSSGTNVGQFSGYELEYYDNLNDVWTSTGFVLENGGLTPVTDGLLGTFNVNDIEGEINIRLTTSSTVSHESIEKTTYFDVYLKEGWPLIIEEGLQKSLIVGEYDLSSPGKEIIVPTSPRIISGPLWIDGNIYGLNNIGQELFFMDDVPGNNGEVRAISFFSSFDFDGDNQEEYVFMDEDGLVIANGDLVEPGFPKDYENGESLWFHSFSALSDFSPIIADLDGDGTHEIFYMTRKDGDVSDTFVQQIYFHVIDRQGNEFLGFPHVIDADEFSSIQRAGAIGDVDNDGDLEIFMGVGYRREGVGNLNILDRWEVYALDHQGNLLDTLTYEGFTPGPLGQPSTSWKRDLGEMVLTDIDEDGKNELVFIETIKSSTALFESFLNVRAFNFDGDSFSELWEYQLSGSGVLGSVPELEFSNPDFGGSIALGNLDSFFGSEIVLSHNAGQFSNFKSRGLRILNSDGTLLESIPSASTFENSETTDELIFYQDPQSFTLADLNGDGKQEILALTHLIRNKLVGPSEKDVVLVIYSDNFPVFTVEAQPLINSFDENIHYDFNSKSLSAKHSFIIEDIDEDGYLEAILGLQGTSNIETSVIYVWDLPFEDLDRNEWTKFQGDNQRTGVYHQSDSTTISESNPPTTSVLSPGDSSVIIEKVLVTADASDDSLISSVDFILIDSDSTETLFGKDIVAPYENVLSTRDFENGDYQLMVRAKDSSGNVGEDIIEVTIDNSDIEKPNTLSSFSILWPMQEYWHDTFGFILQATDNEEIALFELYFDDQLFLSSPPNNQLENSYSYGFDFDSTLIEDGEYSLLLKVYDAEGNYEEEGYDVIIDNSLLGKPFVKTTGLYSSTYSETLEFDIVGTGNEDILLDRYEVHLDGELYSTIDAINSLNVFEIVSESIDTRDYENGLHEIKIILYNVNGVNEVYIENLFFFNDYNDVNQDNVVDIDDVVQVILNWGTNPSNPNADVDRNGEVNIDDLVSVIINWDYPDSDGDTFNDNLDNCPDVYNFDQNDIDEDGLGFACDYCVDVDGDGFGNPGFVANTCGIDNCPSIVNIGQEDFDLDGIGDACDLQTCGLNGVEPGEQCDDGNDIAGDGCHECNIEQDPFCGDGIIQSPNDNGMYEECDSTNLDGQTCETQGFDGGQLECEPFSCVFDYTGCDLPSENNNFVFVSSQQWDLTTGIGNADLHCNSLAESSTFYPWLGQYEWKAWLSDSSNNAIDRISVNDGPFYLVDNNLIADNWQDLISCDGLDGECLKHQINRQENGAPTFNAIATGTDSAGQAILGSNCLDWSDSSGLYKPGNSASVLSDWTEKTGFGVCSQQSKIYCFSVGLDANPPAIDVADDTSSTRNSGRSAERRRTSVDSASLGLAPEQSKDFTDRILDFFRNLF